MAELPEGTVTFLFSDVEGSTRLLERHGSAMGEALATHHRLFEGIVERHNGVIFETIGDAVYAAFSRPADAVEAAIDVQRGLASADWGVIGRLAVRIAIHTGQVERHGDHYFGNALFRAARLQALGYGEQTLLSGITAALVGDALPDGASLRDLGWHRLKDLGQPEHVHQLVHGSLRDAFPALKSLDAHPHNLPFQLSSFVGRDAELVEVADLLNNHRLVTVRGPGGIGKTRLALQVAADRLERHEHGAWFVDLAALNDPEFVPSAIATTLGLRELPGEPIARTLADHLRDRELLLILDNLEQLLPAAAPAVADLLAASPRLRVLVTSRAPLRIRGEWEYAIKSLSGGDPVRQDAGAPPAVALFVERARGIGQGIVVDDESGPLIAEICTRCDGLPLAIELAAARLRVFSLRQLRDRLVERLELLAGGAHDLPARHRTLRSAVAWSVDLLPEPARRLFAQLGIFVGGFSLEAVEAVAITGGQGKTHELLDELLAHSLIRRLDGGGGDGDDEPRFAMLETIREFAAERLVERAEREEIRERHARWLIDLLRRSLAQWPRPGRDAFTRLAADLDSLRAALARPIPADTRLALVANAWLLWEALGLLREGLRWLEEALSQASEETADRAAALRGAAVLWLDLGDVPRATAYADQSLELARRLGDDQLAWRALNILAVMATDPDEAMRNLQECIELQRRCGSAVDAGALVNLGWIAYGRGDRDGAVTAYRESLRVSQETGDHSAAAASLTGLAWIALLDDDPDAATRWAQAALEAGERSGEPIWEAEALVQLAAADLARGEPDGAAERLERAIAELGRGEWEDVRPSALALTAELALLAGNGHHAARLLASAMALRERLGGDWSQIAELDRGLLARIVAAHPDAPEAYDEGRRLDSSTALALAQEWLAAWRRQRDATEVAPKR